MTKKEKSLQTKEEKSALKKKRREIVKVLNTDEQELRELNKEMDVIDKEMERIAESDRILSLLNSEPMKRFKKDLNNKYKTLKTIQSIRINIDDDNFDYAYLSKHGRDIGVDDDMIEFLKHIDRAVVHAMEKITLAMQNIINDLLEKTLSQFKNDKMAEEAKKYFIEEKQLNVVGSHLYFHNEGLPTVVKKKVEDAFIEEINQYIISTFNVKPYLDFFGFEKPDKKHVDRLIKQKNELQQKVSLKKFLKEEDNNKKDKSIADFMKNNIPKR